MNKSLPLVAVLLASAALLMAVWKSGRVVDRRASPVPPDSLNALVTQVERLETELQTLQATTRELGQQLALLESTKAVGAVGRGEATHNPQRLEGLGPAELSRLKQQLDELAAQEREAAKAKELATAHAIVLDPNQPLEARVKLAHRLKQGDQFDAPAIQAMADLYRQTDKSQLEKRLIVLDALSGVTPLELRDQIFADLTPDVQGLHPPGLARKFRHVAIGALAPMLPDPSVQEWLNYLAQNDPDPDIAARAGKMLNLPPSPPVGGRGK